MADPGGQPAPGFGSAAHPASGPFPAAGDGVDRAISAAARLTTGPATAPLATFGCRVERGWPTWRPSTLTLAALAIAIGTRIILWLVTWVSLRALPRLGYYPAQLPDAFLAGFPALDGWARWDTAHYVAVARLGYGDPTSPSPHGGVGFFPLYPMLMRGLVEVAGVAATPAALAVAGIVIANVAFLFAIPLVARLAADHVGEDAARQVVALLCLAPFGFFFNAAYSESLFLALAAGALLAARRNRPWVAAGLAGLASGSRLFGLALVPALLLGAWRRGASRRDLLATAALAPLGAVVTTVYFWVETGTPFTYFRAQATRGGWDDHLRAYVTLFTRLPGEALGGDPRHLVIVLNVLLGVVAVITLPAVWRRLDPATALFTTLIVVVHAGFTWVSLGRYLLPAIGVWVVLGEVLTRPRWRGWPRDLAFATSAILLTLLTVLFSHGFWVV